jgi:hypothetical protein
MNGERCKNNEGKNGFRCDLERVTDKCKNLEMYAQHAICSFISVTVGLKTCNEHKAYG